LWDGTEKLDESRIITVKGCKYIHDIPTNSIGWFVPDDGEIVYSLKITVNGVKYVVNTQDNIVYTNYDLEEEVIGIWNGTDIEIYYVIEEKFARLNDAKSEEFAKINEKLSKRNEELAKQKEELAKRKEELTIPIQLKQKQMGTWALGPPDNQYYKKPM